jgi:hypothetical protein
MGSAGMLVAMFYLVFMGLPSAGAVSPPEARAAVGHGDIHHCPGQHHQARRPGGADDHDAELERSARRPCR